MSAAAPAHRRAPLPRSAPAHGAAPAASNKWATMRKEATRKASKVGDAVGRWFGVTDADGMEQARAQYRNTKEMQGSTMRKSVRRRSKGFENSTAIAQAMMADEGDTIDLTEVDHKDAGETTDMAVGLEHYRQLRQTENERVRKPGWFGGEANRHRKSVAAAGFGRSAQAAPKGKLREEQNVRMQLAAMPTFSPIFIFCITLLQLLIAVGVCSYSYTQGEWAKIALTDARFTCTASPVSSPACPDDFDGTALDGAVKRTEANFWIGPTSRYLSQYGSLMTECMRDDTDLLATAARERQEQCNGVGNACEVANGGPNSGYGCCKLTNARTGMTSKPYCENQTLYSSWSSADCSELTDYIVLRPCCGIGLSAKCQMLTRTACLYYGGEWHSDKLRCADVLCLTALCHMLKIGGDIQTSTEFANEPKSPNQWFRFIFPLFIHAGIIHAVLLLAIQYYFGAKIERQAGFLRVFLIYFISGIGGYSVAGIFAPGHVAVGADPAVFGLIAVSLVELFQAWQIIPNPKTQLAKLLAFVVVALMVGTLPYVDNWSHIGGFCFGAVSGIVFLPYITFGKWDARRKRILLVLCIPLLMIMFIVAFVMFYMIQNPNFCSWCQYINCVPYSSALPCDAVDV